MPSITEWSTYGYVSTLFFIVLCDDTYAIVFISRHLYVWFFLAQKKFCLDTKNILKKLFIFHHQGWQVLPCHTTLLVLNLLA